MAVHIITDSASDLTQADAARLGVQVLPLTVHFGQQEYLDGVSLTHDEFYTRLQTSEKLPTTSQATPWQYRQALEALPAGDDAVILTVSGAISGTLQSALIAAGEFGARVQVVDTRNATLGQRVLVEYAVRLREAGLAAREIADELLARRDSVCLLGVVDTLEYLQKGGRVSKTVAIAGGLLNIKPVLTVEDGKIVMLGKARGLAQSNNLLNTTVEKRGGINFKLPYVVGYSGNDDTALRRYLNDSAYVWKSHTLQVPTCRLGCTIGTHTGPGAVAVAFFTPSEG